MSRAADPVPRMAVPTHRAPLQAQQRAVPAASRWDRRARAPSSVRAPFAARRLRGRHRLVALVAAGWVAADWLAADWVAADGALLASVLALVARSAAASASEALAEQAVSAPSPPLRAKPRTSTRRCGASLAAQSACATQSSRHRPMPNVSRIAGFSSFSLSTTWQIEQSLLIARPASFLCSPSWQRKQPSWFDSDGYAPQPSWRSG